MLNVIKRISPMDCLPYTRDRKTKHIGRRANRTELVNSFGKLHRIDGFEVDKGHKNGNEIHIVSKEGVIEIYNKATGKHVTDLIARPQQVKRYYEATSTVVPIDVVREARDHERKQYNCVM